MPAKNASGGATAPSALSNDQASKLNTGARKADLGGVENLLLKLELPPSDWYDVLVWLMREQGAEVGHQWQIVTALAQLEQSLAVDDAVWLLEGLGAELAYRGKDSVFHGASLLLPGWHWTLDSLVMRSFPEVLERLRAVHVHDSYRLGVLYARAHLGDTLTDEERCQVLGGLAKTYSTVRGTVVAFVPTDGELLHYDNIDFANDDVDEDWAAVVRPFASREAWSRAIWEAAAANEAVVSRWERAEVLVDRLLRHEAHASPVELGTVLAFGIVDTSACDGDRAELAKRLLGGLDGDIKRSLRQSLHELAERTEREVPKEVSDVLLPGGAELIEEIDALAAAASQPRNVRIYVPVLGEASANGVAELAAGVYAGPDAEGFPEINGAMMDHLLTLDLAEIPELQAQLDAEAVAFFISERSSNNASELESGEVGVMKLTLKQARDIHEGTPFRLAPVDVPAAAFDADPPAELEQLASKLRALPMRVLGPPMFLQGEARTEGFVLQLSESAIDANFGGGVMYLYDDDGFWQC